MNTYACQECGMYCKPRQLHTYLHCVIYERWPNLDPDEVLRSYGYHLRDEPDDTVSDLGPERAPIDGDQPRRIKRERARRRASK